MCCTICLDGLIAFKRLCFKKRGCAPKRVPPTAIDIALLRVWRYRALAKLFPADEAVLSHIVDYIGDLSLPPMASVSECGVLLGLTDDAPKLEGSQNLVAFAVDSGGSLVLAGVAEQDQHLLIWDYHTSWGRCTTRMILRSPYSGKASCIWLHVAANRLAVGCVDATVQIWNLQDGDLLATCVAQILESTRWTTVGHMHEISVIRSAPTARFWDFSDNTSFWDFANMAGNACVASADLCGVVCLWRDDAHPVMTVNASWEAEKLDLPSGRVTDLATAPGLLICSLTHVVVGFAAPEHAVLFVLSTSSYWNASYPPGQLLAISMLTDSGNASHVTLIACTARGAVLMWNIPDAGSLFQNHNGSCLVVKKTHVLAAGLQIPGVPRSVAISTGENFCWICPKRAGEAEMRWLAPAAGNPHVLHGSVRIGPCCLRSAALLPRKVKFDDAI